jgi:hypothetical protein
MFKPSLTCLLLCLGLATLSAATLAQTKTPVQKQSLKQTPASVPALTPVPTKSQGRCAEEDAVPSRACADATVVEVASADPRSQLQELIQRALQRSLPIGAGRLLS